MEYGITFKQVSRRSSGTWARDAGWVESEESQQHDSSHKAAKWSDVIGSWANCKKQRLAQAGSSQGAGRCWGQMEAVASSPRTRCSRVSLGVLGQRQCWAARLKPTDLQLGAARSGNSSTYRVCSSLCDSIPNATFLVCFPQT